MRKPDRNIEYTGVGFYKEALTDYPLPGQEGWEDYWWDVEDDTTKLDEQIGEGFYSMGAVIRLFCHYDEDAGAWKISSLHPLLELNSDEGQAS